MVFTLLRQKQGRKVSYKYKKRRFNNVNSHVNISESNNLNTSNLDNVIGNSNLLCINVQIKTSFNTLITFQKKTDTEWGIIINKETINEKNMSEEISYHQNSEEVIDHTCDDNGKN